MHRRTHEVDVPLHDTHHPDRHGVHVFTGATDSPKRSARGGSGGVAEAGMRSPRGGREVEVREVSRRRR